MLRRRRRVLLHAGRCWANFGPYFAFSDLYNNRIPETVDTGIVNACLADPGGGGAGEIAAGLEDGTVRVLR